MMRIDLAGWTREATDMDHRDFLAIFEEADRLGFDGVWFNEFHFHQPRIPYPSPHLLAAAILARTERLRVGTSILVLPLHHPLLLAEEIGQLDHQSGGRIDVGIGRERHPRPSRPWALPTRRRACGSRPAFCSSVRPWRRAARPRSGAMAVLRDHGRAPPCPTPHPPIYVAGSTPETLGFAVAQDLPLLFSLEPPEGRQLAVLQALADDRVPSVIGRSSLSRYVVIGRTTAAAAEQLEPLLAGLEQRRRRFAALQGRDVPALDRATLLAERVHLGG